MQQKITQNHRGNRIAPASKFGPKGVAHVESIILHDTPLYQAQGTDAVIGAQGLTLFKNQDRIGQNRRFLCNLEEAGKVPLGMDIEVRELSLYMNFRDNPGEVPAAGVAAAEELYDLMLNTAYVKILKQGKLVIDEIPLAHIPQLNGVLGGTGALGAAKYVAGKGKYKLAEPIELKGGEIFEVWLGFYDQDNGAGYQPSDRFDEAVDVIKNFRFNMHCVRISEPVMG